MTTQTKPKITKQMCRILPMLKVGMSNADIAANLELSEHTVKVHMWRLYKRLGVKNRSQAVSRWEEINVPSHQKLINAAGALLAAAQIGVGNIDAELIDLGNAYRTAKGGAV